MRKIFLLTALLSIGAQAATDNSGNSPAFIMIDLCSNGIGDSDGAFDVPRLKPDVFDIGLDIDADGTIDRWLSQESATYLGRGNSDQINPGAWQRIYFFQLSQYVGRRMKLRIVDKSPDYYMAINSIRVNGADGIVVTNAIPNGFFEADPPLQDWTVLETTVADHSKLIIKDPAGDMVTYSGKFLSTMTDPSSGDFSEQAVLESAVFTLPPITSFIYGNISGGASEFVNLPGANGTDNGSGVYVDIGTATEDPNGKYDPGVDVPLVGFWAGAPDADTKDLGSVFINTSGLEGRRAQVVGFDDSIHYHVALDAIRMNWDWEESIIRNGGFDQDIPTPQSDPNATAWFRESGDTLRATDHPSGSIPGWKVIKKAGATGDGWFFDASGRADQMSDRTYVGTGGGDVSATGVELRSDVFVIQPIPDPAQNVFVQVATAQASDRIRYADDGSDIAFGRVELIVDVNDNGRFDDPVDFHYIERNQGMGMNQSNSGRDLWHFPKYRWYIRPEHQGKKAILRAEDHFASLKSGYGWLCVDDLFVWDGKSAQLAFPNSDFEQGSLDNWTAEISGGTGFDSWLSGSKKALGEGKVAQSVMNNRSVDIDGDYAADTASFETGGGDGGTGVLTSIPFVLPKIGGGSGSSGVIQAFELSNGKVKITYTGTLKSSLNVEGPYQPVPDAKSPWELTPSKAREFFLAQ